MPLLSDYDEIFLEKSWEWLNDPEIKELTLTPDFTKENQKEFYKSLPSRRDYWIKGIIEDNKPIGAMGLKHISKCDAEYWGYIGDKNYWGKGIGNFMIDEAISKSRSLGLREIILQVAKENERARKLYISKGFRKVESNFIEKFALKL